MLSALVGLVFLGLGAACDVPSDAVQTSIWDTKTVELTTLSCSSTSTGNYCGQDGYIYALSIVVDSRDASYVEVVAREGEKSIAAWSSGRLFTSCFTTNGYLNGTNLYEGVAEPYAQVSVTISCHNYFTSCPVSYKIQMKTVASLDELLGWSEEATTTTTTTVATTTVVETTTSAQTNQANEAACTPANNCACGTCDKTRECMVNKCSLADQTLQVWSCEAFVLDDGRYAHTFSRKCGKCSPDVQECGECHTCDGRMSCQQELCSRQGGTLCPGHFCGEWAGRVSSNSYHCMLPGDCEPQSDFCDGEKCCDCGSLKTCWQKECDQRQLRLGSAYTEYVWLENKWSCSQQGTSVGVTSEHECGWQSKEQPTEEPTEEPTLGGACTSMGLMLTWVLCFLFA